jgi:hypothetical protein
MGAPSASAASYTGSRYDQAATGVAPEAVSKVDVKKKKKTETAVDAKLAKMTAAGMGSAGVTTS